MRLRPTPSGAMAALALPAMGIAALQYQSNAAWLVSAWCWAAAAASLLLTWRQLRGIGIEAVSAPDCQAGETGSLLVLVANRGGRTCEALRLALATGGETAIGRLEPGGVRQVTCPLPPRARGLHPLPALRLRSAWPLGLVEAIIDLQPAGEQVVAPTADGEALDGGAGSEGGAEGGSGEGGGDADGHRPWRDGDAFRRIDWRAAARGQGWLVLRREGGGTAVLDLDERQLQEVRPALDHEARLRQLARWVEDAESLGLRYRLRAGEAELPEGGGAAQRTSARRLLAAAP